MSHVEKLLSVQEALTQILATIPQVDFESVSLQASLGRILHSDIKAPHNLPPFNNSSMDGFAVKSADVNQAQVDKPVLLKVVGESSAGAPSESAINSGEAMRIMTGAPVPMGSDSVVPVESTTEPDAMVGKELPDSVEIIKRVDAGEYVRPSGLDVLKGQIALSKGSTIGAAEIGMMAALGVAQPEVKKIPNIAVLSTGDELLELDQKLSPGYIRDANGYSLAASVRLAGGNPIRLPIAADQQAEVRLRLDSAVEQDVDLIISSAGVSMGAHDHVRSVLEEAGSLSFWKINMRPGKPLAYGSYRDKPFIALPGNPVSALVTFQVFVAPIIARSLGKIEPNRVRVWASVAAPIQSDGRESYLRAILHRGNSGYVVRLTGTQDSAVLSSLVQSNCLVIVPAGTEKIEAGDLLETWLTGEIVQGRD